MSRKTITIFTDDLDGSTIDVTTIYFGLDNRRYTIDLSAENATKLRKALDKYLMAGQDVDRLQRARTVAGQSASATALAEREQRRVVRVWWHANYEPAGLPQPGTKGRGRIPDLVQQAYKNNHGRPVPRPVRAPAAPVVHSSLVPMMPAVPAVAFAAAGV